MGEILRYKRDFFECEDIDYYIYGEILGHEKELHIRELELMENNISITKFLKEQLTLLMRYYWDKYHIRFNKIVVDKDIYEKYTDIKNMIFTLDFEYSPVHKKSYKIADNNQN